MKLLASAALALFAIPGVALAAVHDCPSCVIGLWDDAAMTQPFGNITRYVPKALYVGVKLQDAMATFSAIELSITGLTPADGASISSDQCLTNPSYSAMFGTWLAPADTTQVGGIIVSWSSCMPANTALFRLTMQWFGPTPVNRVLRVTHRYPPSNPCFGLSNPIATACNPPWYDPYRVRGGSYVLNPVVAIDGKTWGVVKELFR
jgi:hypothetical protein